ncbi:MAG: hypothetical protein KC468_18625 [Myxococcales bacterium]|nr:hypothetical protein [Myxococcales bacterium]
MLGVGEDALAPAVKAELDQFAQWGGTEAAYTLADVAALQLALRGIAEVMDFDPRVRELAA